MRKIQVIADTTADILPETAKAYNIRILPVEVNFGLETYYDQETITTEQIYAKVKETNIYPKTSATNASKYEEVFKEYLDQDMDIIFMTISSKISSSMNNAILAAKNLNASDRVTVIDSLSLSYETGLQVVGICEDIIAGYTIPQIVERNLQRRKRLQGYFCVETMTYLYKGGRCSSLAAVVGKIGKIKPIIVIRPKDHPKEGYLEVYKLSMGKMTKAIDKMLDPLFDAWKAGKIIGQVYIVNSRASEAVAYIKERLLDSKFITEDCINIREANGVIACHCGEGTSGIFYEVYEPSEVK